MADLRALIMASDDWAAHGPFRKALEVLDGALRLWGTDEIALSFNGGKDATVLLHLVRAAAAGAPWGNGDGARCCVRCVYFEEDTFEEVREFIRDMEETFSLRIERFAGGDLKAGCHHFVERGCKAFVLGTRRSDPHGKHQESFSPSSPGWASFMRVNPILDWSYRDVWRFLVGFHLAYCPIYDQGYTSIGHRSDTARNALLRLPDGSYLPAHRLDSDDAEAERQGRSDRPPPPPASPRAAQWGAAGGEGARRAGRQGTGQALSGARAAAGRRSAL
jgi:FAD synthetase